MEAFYTFCVAFFFSFIGTIPPGTLNLTIIQLGLREKMGAAWRMSLAAALIEYPYAWAAVAFQERLTSAFEITHTFHLAAGVVMVVLGAFNLLAAARPSRLTQRFESSGFRRGLIISILNPMAIPFWMAMTAYLKSYGWIDLSDRYEVHGYLLGVSGGTLVLCMLLGYLARKVVAHFKTNSLLQKGPGVVLILLGFYAFAEYIFE